MLLTKPRRRCGSLAIIAVLCFSMPAVAAEAPPDLGAAGLYQALLQLKTTGSVLHIVAHPDDEDGAMLTYCARGFGARTTLFSITRGEGGANLISRHFFDELGILRTLEHQESAKYYGIELRYSHAVDYGYSKTLREAMDKWGGEEPVLGDLVRVVRELRPDVIVARFRGDGRDGHGHHQFAGVMAQRVMDAAGDPARFPEQIKAGLQPWQPKKLYVNVHPDWRPEDKDAWTVAVPTGEFNPVLGRSYAQVARYGLGFQRSQGISGHDGPAGESYSYYRLEKTKLPGYTPDGEETFFDGLDTSITGLIQFGGEERVAWLVDGLKECQGHADRAWELFDPRRLEVVTPTLVRGRDALQRLIDEVPRMKLDRHTGQLLFDRLVAKRFQFELALRRSLDLDLQATARVAPLGGVAARVTETAGGFHSAVPGQTLVVEVRVVNRSHEPVDLIDRFVAPRDGDWKIEPFDQSPVRLDYNKPWIASVNVQVPLDVSLDRPAWRRESIKCSFYSDDPGGSPRYPDHLMAIATFKIGELALGFTEPVHIHYDHPEYGQVRYPLLVVPRISLAFDSPCGIVPRGRSSYPVRLTVRNQAPGESKGTVRLELPEGWTSEPAERSFSLARADEEKTLAFNVTVPEAAGDQPVELRAVAQCAGREYREGFTTITARDLGRYNYYRPAVHRVRVVDLNMAAGLLRVGYVMGSGDDVPAALTQLGVEWQLLDAEALAGGDLDQFDAILIGVRAYAVRADLVAANARLLEYVHRGGTLIVQYQTPEFDHNFGPYPYKMGRNPEEVSEEDAAVTMLEPEHPLLTAPNRITAADFDDWIEQRGSKFWQSWDERYVPLLECHDHEQPRQTGGMLYAEYGQGAYIYAAYAWYRQLPEGVPGAYRLFANMVAHRRTPRKGN